MLLKVLLQNVTHSKQLQKTLTVKLQTSFQTQFQATKHLFQRWMFRLRDFQSLSTKFQTVQSQTSVNHTPHPLIVHKTRVEIISSFHGTTQQVQFYLRQKEKPLLIRFLFQSGVFTATKQVKTLRQWQIVSASTFQTLQRFRQVKSQQKVPLALAGLPATD